MLETRSAELRPPCCFSVRRKGGKKPNKRSCHMALGAPGGDDATGTRLTSCEGRCSSSAHCAPHHIQGVDSWNCSFYASGVGWFGGLTDGGETSKQDDFAQASFYLLKCGVMWGEASQVPLRGGSRLGRAASHPARRGGGRCSR